ncbi:MAG TPA: PilW family protein [Polyangia bacterium]|nr:PilW family protein [Polyangia bacterium]
MRSRGFTLIELMVSMALFGLIAVGAMSLVMSGARMQAHSSRVDLAQNSLRTALDLITRDVLAAASGAKNTGMITIPGGTTVNAIDFTGNAEPSAPYANGTDKLELYSVDGSTIAQLTSAVAGSATTLPISYETLGSHVTVGSFTKTTSPYNSWVQVFDFNSAAVAQLTGVSGTTLTVSAMPAGFAASAYVAPSRHVIYYVADKYFQSATTSANSSMLMMAVNDTAANALPLAEGVEDLQIAYGFDNDGDGVVTEKGATANDDEWLFNVSGETQGTWLPTNLRKVRITIVATSTSVDTGAKMPARPAEEDHAAGTSTLGFVRRVLRTEIAVRNLN